MHYLNPTQESGRALMMRGIAGDIVMLNLLRFRKVADYSTSPELAPSSAISGVAAFQRYIEHALPFLHASGGELPDCRIGGFPLLTPHTHCLSFVAPHCAAGIRARNRGNPNMMRPSTANAVRRLVSEAMYPMAAGPTRIPA